MASSTPWFSVQSPKSTPAGRCKTVWVTLRRSLLGCQEKAVTYAGPSAHGPKMWEQEEKEIHLQDPLLSSRNSQLPTCWMGSSIGESLRKEMQSVEE